MRQRLCRMRASIARSAVIVRIQKRSPRRDDPTHLTQHYAIETNPSGKGLSSISQLLEGTNRPKSELISAINN
jgi:hypothetical protein